MVCSLCLPKPRCWPTPSCKILGQNYPCLGFSLLLGNSKQGSSQYGMRQGPALMMNSMQLWQNLGKQMPQPRAPLPRPLPVQQGHAHGLTRPPSLGRLQLQPQH